MLNPRYVQVGSINGGATPINADVTMLGSAVPVLVTLSAPYQIACPPGYPSRPSMTGASATNLNYPRTIPSGATLGLLSCESNALIAAGGTTIFPGFSSIGLIHGTNPTLTIAISGASLNTSDTPATSSFTVMDGLTSIPVSGVTVNSASVTLALTGTINLGDTVTLSYTPPGTSPIQNTNGLLMAAIVTAPVTVS